MRLVPINTLFDITYGTKLDLNKMSLDDNGVAFISRTSKNNGVVAFVEKKNNITPYPPGSLTIALGGSILSTFLQVQAFYTGQNVAVATPKYAMSENVLLYYAMCITCNRFRYSTCGREANRTFRQILIPDLNNIPDFVQKLDIDSFGFSSRQFQNMPNVTLKTGQWVGFRLDSLFDIERGKGPRKKDIGCGVEGTPFITSTDQKNGLCGYTDLEPMHSGNVITLARNGSVGEAFYQSSPFCSTEDIHVLNPRFHLNPYIGMFIATLLRLEKYRFGYGRKWGLERMKSSIIKLPVDSTGEPDWVFMENYIKSLPFSSGIEDKKEPGILGYMRQEARKVNPNIDNELQEIKRRFFRKSSDDQIR